VKEYLSFARELGHQAGQQLLDWRGRAAAQQKSDGSLVTEADQAVDRFLCEQIRSRYPDHGIISEEADTIFENRPLTWVIDPLDGTTNFALGLAHWGCSIALVADGFPALGVVAMPQLGVEYWTVRSQGAFFNGDRLGGPLRNINGRNSFVAICSRTWKHLELSLPFKGRLLGSAVYDLAAVAQGIAIACTQVTSHIWDVAAGWLLLQETGRTVGPLLPGAPKPFPMRPGADYEGLVFPLAAGSDQAVFQQVIDRVRIKPGSRDRFEALAAAGWDATVWRTGRA